MKALLAFKFHAMKDEASANGCACLISGMLDAPFSIRNIQSTRNMCLWADNNLRMSRLLNQELAERSALRFLGKVSEMHHLNGSVHLVPPRSASSSENGSTGLLLPPVEGPERGELSLTETVGW